VPPSAAPCGSGGGQARVAALHPGVVHASASAAQESRPGVAAGGAGCLGTPWRAHRAGPPLAGPPPEPGQRGATRPGRVIHSVDRGLPRLPRTPRLGRGEGLGQPVPPWLDGPHAAGDLQHGGTQRLPQAAALAIGPGACPQAGPAPGAVSRGRRRGPRGFLPGATACPPALLPDPVRHLQRDRRQRAGLRRVGRRGQRHRRVATRTPLRPERLDRCGWLESLALAWMARLPPRCAGGC